MKLSSVFAGIALFGPAPAISGVHPPDVEQHLSFLVADWTIEGSESTYREHCEWYVDRSFVVCNTVNRAGGGNIHSVSIVGYSAPSQSFTHLYYNQSGHSRSEPCFANQLGGLTCIHDQREGGKLIQTRTHFWPVADGAQFRQERSENGGPWTDAVQFKFVPRR